MTELITRDAGALAIGGDLGAAFDAFDAAAARFLATRKSQRTAGTYRPGLELYRAVALDAGADPLKADALILFNKAMEARRRDRGGDLANDTIRARLYAVQSFFSWSWAFDLTPVKPALVGEILNPPPARKLSPRDILTPDEARRLIDAAGDLEARCLIRVMIDGGLRISEALALRLGDAYPASDRYYLHVASGKGDKERDPEIPADLYRDLVAYARSQGLDLRDPGLAEERLFSISRPTAWRRVKATAAAAGIAKRITPHALRHTHAHHLRLREWPLELIADRLGHSNLDTTKIYTRPAEMELQIALPAMPWAEGE